MKNTAKKNTAKIALIGLIFASTAGFTAPAEARGYDSRGHHGYYGGHRGYRHHGYRHGSHSSHRGAYLAGGLIIGSLLTHAYHRNNDRYVNDTYVVRETRVVSEPRIVSRSTGRRLFRDRNGDCFERTTTRNGDELLLELDPSECAW